LLSKRHKRRDLREGLKDFGMRQVTVSVVWSILVVFFLSAAGVLEAMTKPMSPDAEDFAVRSVNETAASSVLRAASDVNAIMAGRICSEVYKGDFAAARRLLEQNSQFKNTYFDHLDVVVSEYEAIAKKRESARQAAYVEKLAELEKLKAADDTDVNDVNDVNDVDGIQKAFSAIANVCEFANEQQREELLAEPFVKDVFQKAIERSSELESEAKWLDAYTNSYYWLAGLVPDNKEYSDYAQQLIDKANIVASFQDSPCESRRERFSDVKREMFIRAIELLDSHYVDIDHLDYSQMAAKAIERCQLLAEVVNSSSVVREALRESYYDANEIQYEQYARKLSAFSAGLKGILEQVEYSLVGIRKDEFTDVFKKVLALNETTVGLPRRLLIVQFSEAALEVLDRYTVMIWPRQVEDFDKLMTNEFTGIGIEIAKLKGLLTAVSLLPDTPAYHSGLDAGDVIVAVDGQPTKGMSLMCAVKNITGPAGTEVVLTVRGPDSKESRDITITRAKITVPTIRGWQRTRAGKWLYMIDEERKIGYVRLTGFDERTSANLEKVLLQLESQGMAQGGLILDLRFNTGGLLDSAVEVADKFIKEGMIVSTRPRFPPSYSYKSAEKDGTHPEYPVVILINSGSASASEIVAGALADEEYNRASLVGERTHGKGSVQTITSYPQNGAQLKYTMANYYLPSGQKVESRETMEKLGREDWGIAPDIEVKLRSDELKKLLDVQKDNDVLVKADHDIDTGPLKKHTIEETLAADVQLAVGVLVIKTKLIEAEVSALSAN